MWVILILLLIKTRLIEDYNFALDTRAICAPSLANFSVVITSPYTPSSRPLFFGTRARSLASWY